MMQQTYVRERPAVNTYHVRLQGVPWRIHCTHQEMMQLLRLILPVRTARKETALA